ncbi:DUF2975 domain-containing protein [Intestinibacter sp.]|uniref:DUF2975 domain-containing protein n=1 Tax=Intestinibacter sp. TaxID=1965304 RepID=UPI0025BCF3AD|nr:DUF2975 domain-containing protein [Intestinibacter sp.]MCI6736899.1 DUF2975 domain-containing protein [Intestinibacter sp.]MDY2735340.1 DUF2975 domain-containing protein [Intestinibacter sp.]MDY4574858.1 DUF2975 domain-containing protein [Intestinibacter sp.]
MKQNELARSLKLFISLTCIILAIVALVIVPIFGRDIASEYPEYSYMFYPCLIFIWITAIPFYGALFEGWKISNEINNDNSFSKKNMDSLNKIRRYALSECILYFIGAIILLFLNLLHPSILIIILFIIFVAMCISVFTAVLAHLVQKACDLKDENDLTI